MTDTIREATDSTGFRYMTRFHCVGAACESTCCAGWEVQVDQAHHKKLRKSMERSPSERQEFDSSLTIYKGVDRSRGKYALVVLQPGGRCSFLQKDDLCSVHARYGEETLSDTCAVYPRAFAKSGARRELTGSVSCPEVARQLLLHEDAMDLVAIDGSAFVRPTLSQVLPDSPSPYQRHHDVLTNLVSDLLSPSAFPLDSRVFFVAYFANRVGAYLSSTALELDDSRLAADIEQILDPSFLTALDQRYRALELQNSLSIQLVLHVLASRGMKSTDGSTEEALAEYQTRKAYWQGNFGDRIDLYFANYAKNYWVKEWYARSPSLLAHTQSLLVRMALLRFLFFGHPSLRAAEGLDRQTQSTILDRTVVEVVHRFSRQFEHDSAFVKNLESTLAEQGKQTLAHAVCLAKF